MTVSVQGLDSGVDEAGVGYFAPELFGVTPRNGPTQAGFPLTLAGANFGEASVPLSFSLTGPDGQTFPCLVTVRRRCGVRLPMGRLLLPWLLLPPHLPRRAITTRGQRVC